MAASTGTNHGHDDMVHDAQLDYYGRRLATCSSDRTVKLFEVEGESQRLVETLRGHDSAVWAVAWAHPSFGNILASCSYDGKVLIWREQNGAWQRIYEYAQHSDSVNAISWAPVDTGCHLACASSDGSISIITFANSTWTSTKHIAHPLGVYGISWSPSVGASLYLPTSPTSPSPPAPAKRFVTAGADSTIKIWAPSPDVSEPGYVPVATLVGHQDIVRDVAWAPTLLNKAYIASASQDKTVRVWTNLAGPGDAALDDHTKWKCTVLEFERECWKVSWSLAGNILAVACGDGRISLHKENLKGEWSVVKELEE